MSQFRSSGGLDDPVLTAGDRAFLRVSRRLEPWQLEAGEVSLSVNGRMDRGVWQPRRGIENISGVLQEDELPLKLPFYIKDEAGGWGGAVYIDVAGTLSPDAVGAYVETGTINGKTLYQRVNPTTWGIAWSTDDTRWEISSLLGVEYYTTNGDVATPDLGVWTPAGGSTGTPTVTAPTSTISASRVDELVTVTAIGHGLQVYADGTAALDELSGYLGFEGATGTVDPNGVQFMTMVDGATFTFLIDGATGNETYGGTMKIRSVIDDSANAEILGSCVFSDPSSESDEFVIVAAKGGANKVSVTDGSVEAITYPTGLQLEGEIDVRQAFDRVFIFRDGERSLEWRTPLGRVPSSAELATNVVTIGLVSHGLTTGDTVVISGVGPGATDPNGSKVVTVPDADTFTYPLTGGDEVYAVSDTSKVLAGFTFVRGGDYTQPEVFEVSSTDADVTDGLASFTVVGNTTITEGQTIKIFSSTDSHFSDQVGRSYLVTAATATLISFYIPVADHGSSGTDYVVIGRDVSIGAGFSHMPAPPFAAYHQRRLIVPLRYSVGGTDAASTYTDRNVRDEIVISDILDPDTYDVISNQFRITAGVADFLVGFHPFYDDTLLVFNRNSIHGAFGLSGSLADVATKELTREIGCVARKSIVQHGKDILFLSDSGVYGVSFLDEYNLRGVDLPLSDPIQPEIDRINPDLAALSVGVYFDNRYRLAVPLDSVPGAGDATGNNAILVYNFLNQGWESVDTFGDPRWTILNFHISRAGERNDLYAVNSTGGLHKLESKDSDFDELAIVAGGGLTIPAVPWEFSSRQYDFATHERKRFNRVQLQVEGSEIAGDCSVSLITEDPDTTTDMGLLSSQEDGAIAAGEDYSFRMRPGGVRGHGATVAITTGDGRPRIKAVAVQATSTNRSTIATS